MSGGYLFLQKDLLLSYHTPNSSSINCGGRPTYLASYLVQSPTTIYLSWIQLRFPLCVSLSRVFHTRNIARPNKALFAHLINA